MLASISPLGERARGRSWRVTATAYVVASALAGAGTGAVAGLLGGLVPASVRGGWTAAAVVALACVAGLVLDVHGGPAGPPSWRRQVDERWLDRYRGWVYGAGFGLQLGTGVVTIVTSSTVYATWLLAALAGRADVGALLGLAFGLVRALPLLALRGTHDRAGLHRVFDRLERWRRPADLVARGALVAAAAALGVAAAGAVGAA